MNVKNKTLKVTGAAVFSAISIVFALTLTPLLPRLAWGIALIDPVSIVWVLCFLIFGFASGILCSLIGFISLFAVDPFIPWGPMFKLAATLPLIIIPYILLKIENPNSKNNFLASNFKSIKKYFILTLPAVATRCVVMVAANLLFFVILIPYAIAEFGGLLLITVIVIAINIIQSIWDLYIPWLITYPTGLYKSNKVW